MLSLLRTASTFFSVIMELNSDTAASKTSVLHFLVERLIFILRNNYTRQTSVHFNNDVSDYSAIHLLERNILKTVNLRRISLFCCFPK